MRTRTTITSPTSPWQRHPKVIVPHTYVDPTELLEGEYTELECRRRKPVVFTVDGLHIVCMPLTYKDSPAFIRQLSKLLVRHYEIFRTIEWPESLDGWEAIMPQMVKSIRIYSATKIYKNFILKDIPAFIEKWTHTITGKGENLKYVQFNTRKRRQKLKKALATLEPDTLLEMFFWLYAFNFLYPQFKTADFLKALGTTLAPSRGIDQALYSSSTTGNICGMMPEYSPQPFSAEELTRLRQASITAKKGMH